jgi:ABC-type nitrate/sulfonate/bicarbonate transport system substrate-binding protein
LVIGAPDLATDPHFSVVKVALELGYLADLGVPVRLVEMQGGSGDVAAALARAEIDIGIGLTESLLAAAATSAGIRVLDTLVSSPLRWAVPTRLGGDARTVEDLRRRRVGVTRKGSGSHLAWLALAQEREWERGEPVDLVELGSFHALIHALAKNEIDAFAWEYSLARQIVTTFRFAIPEAVRTPWPSFIVCGLDHVATGELHASGRLLAPLRRAAQLMRREPEYAAAVLQRQYPFSGDDALRWLEGVRFADSRAGDLADLKPALDFLVRAGMIPASADASRVLE